MVSGDMGVCLVPHMRSSCVREEVYSLAPLIEVQAKVAISWQQAY